MNPIKDLISGGLKGIADSAANIIGKFKADPTKVAEAEASLKELAINAELESQRIAIEAEKIKAEEIKAYLADTANSRDMNTRIQESDKASFWAKNTGYFLDVFIGLIWGIITVYLVARALKVIDNQQADLTAVLSLYSTVTAVFMICVQFHRGSSIGSRQKGEQLDKIRNKG